MIKVDKDVAKKTGTAIYRITIKDAHDPPKEKDLEYERLLWIIHMVIGHQINSFFLEKALRKIPRRADGSYYRALFCFCLL